MNRKYQLDDRQFEVIDTEVKSYFLGLYASDGCTQRNRICIKLKDLQILEDIRNCLFPNYPIKEERKDKRTYYRLTVNSKLLTESVRQMGLGERKTWSLEKIPAQIPTDLVRHFIRGYFDGDGTIGKRTQRKNQVQLSIASVRREMLESIKHFLTAQKIHSTIYLEKRRGRALPHPQGGYNQDFLDMWRLIFTTHQDRENFIKLCWSDNHICLDRKYTLIKEYIQKRDFYYRNTSFKYPWEEIYQRYLNGEEVPALSKEYGFYIRSLYTWIHKVGKFYRSEYVAHHLGNQVIKTASKLLENPKAQLATTESAKIDVKAARAEKIIGISNE